MFSLPVLQQPRPQETEASDRFGGDGEPSPGGRGRRPDDDVNVAPERVERTSSCPHDNLPAMPPDPVLKEASIRGICGGAAQGDFLPQRQPRMLAVESE